MQRRDFLERWGLSSLKLNLKFLEAEFQPRDPDRNAAWELYVELLTRIATQHLKPEHGDEKTALDSIHALFSLTRDILRRHGSGAGEFAKLAIPVLNQVIRPFTAKWHRLSLAGAFQATERCAEFRAELAELQSQLRHNQLLQQQPMPSATPRQLPIAFSFPHERHGQRKLASAASSCIR